MVPSNRIGQVKPKLKKSYFKIRRTDLFKWQSITKITTIKEYLNFVCISRTSCCHRQIVPEIQNIGKNKKNYLKNILFLLNMKQMLYKNKKKTFGFIFGHSK